MVVIAIDGPGGSGKSTIARVLGERLGLAVLDTGSMYRALTLLAERRGVPGTDAEGLAALAREMELEPGERVLLFGEDVSGAIRSREIDARVSTVAAHPAVRAELVRRQREWVSAHSGAVVEGRDITSVVLPDAEVRVYLTASELERARRRAEELGRGQRLAEPIAPRRLDRGATRWTRGAPSRRSSSPPTRSSSTRPSTVAASVIAEILELAHQAERRTT